MKFTYRENPWRKKFALLPVFVSGKGIWLEWYWQRWGGDCYEISFSDTTAPKPAPEGIKDEFNGGDAHLIECINALLELDAAGALVPHGIGGHARGLLSAAAVCLAQRSKP